MLHVAHMFEHLSHVLDTLFEIVIVNGQLFWQVPLYIKNPLRQLIQFVLFVHYLQGESHFTHIPREFG